MASCRPAIAVLLAAVLGGITACSDVPASSGQQSSPTPKQTAKPTPKPKSTPKPSTPDPGSEDPPPEQQTPPKPTGNAATWLTIPSIKVRTLRVVAYTGTPDDVPGDRIQDTGRLASPRGARGGVGPGMVGNYLVTGHRTEAGRPFGKLPQLKHGAHVLVSSGGWLYDYVVTETLWVSFRQPASRAAQRAPVPGKPGVEATKPMITLSTCATPEDHAAGNFWSDALGNPEHRIDKVGVLVDVRPVS
jgi:sortase A